MEHLNYCRQLTKQVMDGVFFNAISEDQPTLLRHLRDIAVVAQKFILPVDGVLLHDPEFRGIDDSVPLSLPHKAVALEFQVTGEEFVTKRVVFAVQHDDHISCSHADFYGWPIGRWVAFSFGIEVPREDPFFVRYGNKKATALEKRIHEKDNSCTGPVLQMINALACSNVNIETSKPKRPGKKTRSALQFDSYHVLTIDVVKSCSSRSCGVGSEHRSPREHLRRGHIRRLSDGRKIWVNAAVVGAGNGGGLVTKSYILRGAEKRP